LSLGLFNIYYFTTIIFLRKKAAKFFQTTLFCTEEYHVRITGRDCIAAQDQAGGRFQAKRQFTRKIALQFS
jgi:hypothetical protein